MSRTKEEMIAEFQCPGCMHGPNPKTCSAFALKQMDAGGFACAGHVAGTTMLGGPAGTNGMTIMLGVPSPFANIARTARDNHTLVLIGKKDGQEYIQPKDPMNIPVWKMQHQGSTLVRIARPATGRFTTLIVDGDIDVPAPAVNVGDGDSLI